MENASKALIIAGSILIAVLIISLGVMIFRNMSKSVVEDTSLSKQQIAEFNSKITPYVGNNVSGSNVNNLRQHIISIDNDAKVNKKPGAINMYLEENGGKTLIVGYDANTDEVTIYNKVTTGTFYTVTAIYDDSTGLIKEINVKENK